MFRELLQIYKRAYVNWALNFSLWNLHTLKGEAYTRTYELLHNTGWARLDVAKYPEEYFYSKGEYREFLKVLTIPLNTEQPDGVIQA